MMRDTWRHWSDRYSPEGRVKRMAMRALICTLLATVVTSFCHTLRAQDAPPAQRPRPNILLAIADDWGWPHAGAYGDLVVQTPAFDRLAREGALFQHAYCASPSCTPSRGALLTGQWHWRLGPGANLWCVFPDRFATYPDVLARAGYETGSTGKAWGPGRTETPGRPLAGQRTKNFRKFLNDWSGERPFCFWLGSSDPHRPYEPGVGAASGIDPNDIHLAACFPDDDVARNDVADYYWHVQRFDQLVADALAALEERGELDNTLIVVTSDHGMPFPRGKGNLYDTGTRVPLVVRWPGVVEPNQQIDSFVSLTDLAPTFLAAAQVEIPDDMTGKNLASMWTGDPAEREGDFVLFGKERHVPAQEAPNMGGYPCRGLRTHEYLYIINFLPDRWPAGTPHYERAAINGAWLADCDNGPTKSLLAERAIKNEEIARLYDLSFAKRPAEELYDLREDPEQLENVADDDRYQSTKAELRERLLAELRASGDPRATGGGEEFDRYEYLGGAPKHPDWRKGDRDE